MESSPTAIAANPTVVKKYLPVCGVNFHSMLIPRSMPERDAIQSRKPLTIMAAAPISVTTTRAAIPPHDVVAAGRAAGAAAE